MAKKKFEETDCYIADKSFDKMEDLVKKKMGTNSFICFDKVPEKWRGKIDSSTKVVFSEDQKAHLIEFSGLRDSESCNDSIIDLKNEYDIKEVRKKYLTKMGCYKK